MGNRALIKGKGSGLALYVHWNGGYESVYPVTQYCKLKGYRSPASDSYGLARLCQVYTNFFGGTMSVGIEPIERCITPNIAKEYSMDNGVYEIDKDWNICNHWGWRGEEVNDTPIGSEYLKLFMLKLDECMPEHDRLGKDLIMADEVPVEELKIGDKVFVETFDRYELKTIVGFGTDTYCNGFHVLDKPYVDLYGDNDEENGNVDYSWNVNNYIRTKTARRLHEEE